MGEVEVKYEADARALMEAVDAVLGRGALDAVASAALIDILGSGGAEAGRDVRVVLCVVEHPVVAEALRCGRVPAELEATMTDALAALAPLFGRWMVAPLPQQAERLRQRYDAELRKYELVCDHVAPAPVASAARVLASYLDTSPAPLFERKMRQRFPEAFTRAEALLGGEEQALLCGEEVLELLAFDEKEAGEVGERLDALLAGIAASLERVEPVVRRTLAGKNSEAKLVAGALAARQEMSEMASGLLAMVVEGDRYAPQAAVFAAKLAPRLTLHVLGQFLVDVLKSTGADEEHERYSEASIVAARTVLPWIGSPLGESSYRGKPSAHEIAEKVRRAWAVFG
ncbi:hypothetical protein DL240_07200 [Lujinxingia litoralis]|uniref:Uncharacterized protein n=2 Tax=Lujinxingia litoralis TaxID=2211119 RepID=A0A328C9B1_9DELT|nr:hypothetical protein DL240_07200 [Lujinxingia litoralis]